MTTTAHTHGVYPVRVDARLDPGLSRWLWIVKWFLAIPHYVVLAFLWIAFVPLSVIAFFSILFTGRYPRSIFEFNVGVFRWTWRVSYYAYGALATDRYPPFTLDEVRDYPAHLEVAYPERLSRGLVLVKWWLLAIPHYIIVSLLLGGAWVLGHSAWPNGGLIGLLVLIAAIVLAVTGRYPNALFDVVLGLNRWVIRVAAYAGLMTDEYPPFRLDVGGSEDASTLTVPQPPVSPPDGRGAKQGWTAGRITAVLFGSLFLLGSVAPLVAGSVGLWFDQARRDASRYITFGPERLTTSTYALTTERADFIVDGTALSFVRSALGTIRIRVTPSDASSHVFVGIAEKSDIASYLGGVNRAAVVDLAGANEYRSFEGGPPGSAPGDRSFWAASRSGTGTQTLTWSVEEGSWALVVMNADGSSGLDVRADVGATVPALGPVSIGLIAGAALFVALGLVLVVVPIRRAK